MSVPRERLRRRSARAVVDLLEHEIRAHRRELDGDLRLREVAGGDALELGAALVGEREDEQLLRDDRRIRRESAPPPCRRQSRGARA